MNNDINNIFNGSEFNQDNNNLNNQVNNGFNPNNGMNQNPVDNMNQVNNGFNNQMNNGMNSQMMNQNQVQNQVPPVYNSEPPKKGGKGLVAFLIIILLFGIAAALWFTIGPGVNQFKTTTKKTNNTVEDKVDENDTKESIKYTEYAFGSYTFSINSDYVVITDSSKKTMSIRSNPDDISTTIVLKDGLYAQTDEFNEKERGLLKEEFKFEVSTVENTISGNRKYTIMDGKAENEVYKYYYTKIDEEHYIRGSINTTLPDDEFLDKMTLIFDTVK